MRIELEDGVLTCTLSNGDAFKLSNLALREIASDYWLDLADKRLAPANPTSRPALYAFLGLS